MKKLAFAILLLLCPFIASAQGLTYDQANSIVALLQAFNVDPQTILTVWNELLPPNTTPVTTVVIAGSSVPQDQTPVTPAPTCTLSMGTPYITDYRNGGMNPDGSEIEIPIYTAPLIWNTQNATNGVITSNGSNPKTVAGTYWNFLNINQNQVIFVYNNTSRDGTIESGSYNTLTGPTFKMTVNGQGGTGNCSILFRI